jgi:hypothetical protein
LGVTIILSLTRPAVVQNGIKCRVVHTIYEQENS